jgi:hypothetical protein
LKGISKAGAGDESNGANPPPATKIFSHLPALARERFFYFPKDFPKAALDTALRFHFIQQSNFVLCSWRAFAMETHRENENITTITEREAAQRLGFSLPTLRRWRYAKTGPCRSPKLDRPNDVDFQQPGGNNQPTCPRSYSVGFG